MGSLMVLVFLSQSVIAFVQRRSFTLSFWSFMNAGETAAWRLKWLAIPTTFVVLFVGRKLYKSIVMDPQRYCGSSFARCGFVASTLVCACIAFFIAISIPARIHNRQLAAEAAYEAYALRVDRGFFEYAMRYQTLPSDPQDLLNRLPDPDGSLATALRELGPLGPAAYKPSGSDLASLPQRKPRRLQGLVIRNASIDSASEDRLPAGWSFTNYDLRLPGPDKILGTDDDLIVRDGLITKVSMAGPGVIGSTASTTALKP